jgi:hypothetical protein
MEDVSEAGIEDHGYDDIHREVPTAPGDSGEIDVEENIEPDL